MRIDKVIFGVDDNPRYSNFWPIQADLVRKILGAEPILFYITDEDSDFYFDGHGTIKKINKNRCPGIITSFQSQIIRMYATKYFPEEVCLTADIDMLMINKDYFLTQIEKIDDESLVIFDSDAYDMDREECLESLEYCKSRYPICYVAGKGKNFNRILNTDRTFENYVDDLQNLRWGWGTDELYFGDKVDNTNHGVKVVKLIRKYTTPWKADRRVERHNFPVNLKELKEIEAQKRDGIYCPDKLKEGFYIDVHCPRPYNEYQKEINDLISTVCMENNTIFSLGNKYQTDKVVYHRYDRIYSLFLESLKRNPIKLFEIGCGRDYASFKMWQDYFPEGKIFCMDINEEYFSERGIVYRGDQTKIEDLENMVNLIGKCNVIIDDGSHVPQHQFDTFNFLFDRMLLEGGIYIIEDIECNYWNPDSSVYGYRVGNLNIMDSFSNIPHKINSEFSKNKNHQNISTITYYKNCIILTKKTSEEIDEDKRPYRFDYNL